MHPRILSAQGLTIHACSDDDDSDMSDSEHPFTGTILEVLRHRQRTATVKWKSKTKNCMLSPSLIGALKPSGVQGKDHVVSQQRRAAEQSRFPLLNEQNPTKTKRQRRNSVEADTDFPRLPLPPRRFSLVGQATELPALNTAV